MRCWLADWWIRDDKPTAEVVSCSAAAVPVAVHCVPKKHPRHFQLYLENQLSNFNNFWDKYS